MEEILLFTPSDSAASLTYSNSSVFLLNWANKPFFSLDFYPAVSAHSYYKPHNISKVRSKIFSSSLLKPGIN